MKQIDRDMKCECCKTGTNLVQQFNIALRDGLLVLSMCLACRIGAMISLNDKHIGNA